MQDASASRRGPNAASQHGTVRLKQSVAVALALFASLAAFRVAFAPVHSGYDADWLWGINQASPETFAFGRDIVWTWGPLGRLLFASSIGDNIQQAAYAALILHGLFMASVGILLWSAPFKLARALIFSIFLLLAFPWGAQPETLLCLTLVMLAGVAVRLRAWTVVALLAALCAIALFVKLSVGLVGLPALACAAAGIFVQRRQGARGLVRGLLALSVLPATIAMLSALFFPEAADLARWWVGSWGIVSGYDEAASLQGPAAQNTTAILSLGVLGFATLGALLRRQRLAAYMLPCLFCFFAFYKQGIVRHDSPHFASFTAVAACLLASLVLYARSRREVVFSLGLLVVNVGILVASDSHHLVRWQDWKGPLTGQSGLNALQVVVRAPELTKAWQTAQPAMLKALVWPPAWNDVIEREVGHGVMPVPSNLAACAANPVHCAPLPTLMMYSAFTPALDDWNADALQRSPAILVSGTFEPMFLESPAFWRAALERYSLRFEEPARLLLTPKPAASTYVALGESVAQRDAWVPVPESANLVFAAIDLQLKPLGRLRRLLFRIPALQLETRYASGQVTSQRLFRHMAPQGILINALPKDLHDVAGLFAQRPWDRVVAFRVVAQEDGHRYFEREYGIRWEERREQAQLTEQQVR